MTPNPFTGLLHSRKFWLAILDAFVSSIAIVLGWFLAPDKVGEILTLIGLWQPVLIIVIGSIAYEDAVNVKASASIEVAKSNNPPPPES
jgi:hypothetical protein